MELGEKVERVSLITQIFLEMESLYDRLLGADSTAILQQWRSFSATLGARVRVIHKGKTTVGVALDITDEGALLLRTERGTLLAVHAGDVEHVRTT